MKQITKVTAILLAIVWTTLYAAALIVVRLIVSAVHGGTEAMTSTGAIAGADIQEQMASPALLDTVLATIIVDVIVVLIVWNRAQIGFFSGADSTRDSYFSEKSDVTGVRSGVSLVGKSALMWLVLAFGGLTMNVLVITRWASVDLASVRDLPLALVILLVIIHPLAAEVLFRGAVLGGLLSSRMTIALAVFLQAVLFALVQLSVLLGVFGFVVALLLGAVRARSGQLQSSLVGHYVFVVAGAVVVLAGDFVRTDAAEILVLVLGVCSLVVGGSLGVKSMGLVENISQLVEDPIQ